MVHIPFGRRHRRSCRHLSLFANRYRAIRKVSKENCVFFGRLSFGSFSLTKQRKVPAGGMADSTFSAADSTEIPPTFMRKSREPIPPVWAARGFRDYTWGGGLSPPFVLYNQKKIKPCETNSSCESLIRPLSGTYLRLRRIFSTEVAAISIQLREKCGKTAGAAQRRIRQRIRANRETVNPR